MAEGVATTWYDGEGLPTNDLGLTGDYYLNISTADIFKKISSSWQRIGNIKGTQGLQGLTGEQGPRGVKGDRGDTGPAGPQGPQGTMGKSGSIWYDGVGEPETSLGLVNDYYLNIGTGDIYKKKGAAYWERVSSFLPDLAHYDSLVNALLDKGYEDIYQLNNTFQVNMSNMASTFNKEMNTYKDTFNANMSTMKTTFANDSQSRTNTFNNSIATFNANMTQMRNQVNTFISEKSDELDLKFDEIASVSAQTEIYNARTSIDNTSFNSLQERLNYDFENNAFPKYAETCTNLNNVTKSGLYCATNTSANAPESGTFLVFVMMRDTNNMSQLAFKITTQVTLYTRMKVSGVWSSWHSGGIDINYDTTMANINNNLNKL